MTQKYSETGNWPKPWWWGLTDGQHNHMPDGPYAKALNNIYKKHKENNSGRPPSDAAMDFCACNLAGTMEKIKT